MPSRSVPKRYKIWDMSAFHFESVMIGVLPVIRSMARTLNPDPPHPDTILPRITSFMDRPIPTSALPWLEYNVARKYRKHTSQWRTRHMQQLIETAGHICRSTCRTEKNNCQYSCTSKLGVGKAFTMVWVAAPARLKATNSQLDSDRALNSEAMVG